MEMESKKTFFRGFVYGLGGLFVLVLLIGVVLAYRMPDKMPVVPKVLSFLRAPAAIVDGTIISWRDIQIDVDALSDYITRNKVPMNLTQDQLRQRVIHRLMYAVIADASLQKQGIVIDSAKIDAALKEIVATVGSEENLKKQIETQYGWTFEQYKTRVIRSMVVLQELQKKHDADAVKSGDGARRAEDLLAQIKSGKDFAEVARASSDDSSASDGGELGFISRGMTVPDFEKALFSLKKGEVSGVVKSEFGYHIIQAEELKTVKEKGKPDEVQIRARHILVKNPSIKDAIENELARVRVWQFMHTAIPAKNRLDN